MGLLPNRNGITGYIFAAGLICWLFAPHLVAQTTATLPSMPQPQTALPAQQTLQYSVDWRVFPAGTASFHLQTENGLVHVHATANSVGAIALLFPVADQYDSVLDRATGCSQQYKKQIQEGFRRVSGTLTMDYAQHKQLLSEKNLNKGNVRQIAAPIPNCVTDVLSGIFYLATQPLSVGGSVRFPLADAGRVVAVTANVEAREQITTPAGTFATVRVQPTADAGVVKNRGDILIWYTDDVRHIPVQVRANLFWGTLTLRLNHVADN